METTPATDHLRTQVAAIAYLDLCKHTPAKAEEFIADLQHRLDWTPAELVQVQMRAVEILMERGKSQNP